MKRNPKADEFNRSNTFDDFIVSLQADLQQDLDDARTLEGNGPPYTITRADVIDYIDVCASIQESTVFERRNVAPIIRGERGS